MTGRFSKIVPWACLPVKKVIVAPLVDRVSPENTDRRIGVIVTQTLISRSDSAATETLAGGRLGELPLCRKVIRDYVIAHRFLLRWRDHHFMH
jgi:hypothetical protein